MISHKFFALLLLLILAIFRLSFSQESITGSIASPACKNALKGTLLIVPDFEEGYIACISAGYERYIKKNQEFELCAFYVVNTDMGSPYYTIAIMPGWKIFTISEEENYNNFWFSMYLSYFQNIDPSATPHGARECLYHYGIGASVGKKIKIKRNDKWFIDIGIGVSYNKYFEEPIFSDVAWNEKYAGNVFLPRPILQFGRKF